MEDKKYNVYCFDFDGTITKKDTFFTFLIYSIGYKRFFFYLFTMFFDFVKLFFHKVQVQTVKEKLFSKCFKGESITNFDKKCKEFAENFNTLLRPNAIEFLNGLNERETVLIVSASIQNYISCFLKDFKIEATVPEVDFEGNLTGKFIGKNCKGKEKVERILKHFPDRKNYNLIAFGDSGGDKQMFNIADEKHWKPFRDSKKSRKLLDLYL